METRWRISTRLRHRLFVERNGWQVPSHDGMEYDQFDTPAAVYLVRNLPPGAPERDMPELIRRYNLATGGENTDTAGYHETITQASLQVTRRVLDGLAADAPLHLSANAVLDAGHADKDWLLSHWRRETLFSLAARRGWVDPDLAPLP